MTTPNFDEPEFAIPLDANQLAALGRLTATWSQIDYLIALTAALVTKTDIGSMFLFLEGMMLGARINLLRKLIGKMPTAETQALTESICERLGKIVDRRNHVLHGIWGWHTGKENSASSARPACHNGRNPKSPVYAAELPDLLQRATNETRQLGDLLGILSPGLGVGVAPRKFFFGEGPPPGWKGEPTAQSVPGHRG